MPINENELTGNYVTQKVALTITIDTSHTHPWLTLPSLTEGGFNYQIFDIFRQFQFISTPKFTEILQISTPSHLLPPPPY